WSVFPSRISIFLSSFIILSSRSNSIATNTPLHTFDTVMRQRAGSWSYSKIRFHNKLLLKRFSIDLECNKRIHHSRYGVDLGIVTLLEKFSVTIRVFHNDAVPHGERHK